jgi:site-specific DNA-methyltransferase (adenine-specific)
MAKENLQRIDSRHEIISAILPYCRLKYGDVWTDPVKGHKVGCFDASSEKDIQKMFTLLKKMSQFI